MSLCHLATEDKPQLSPLLSWIQNSEVILRRYNSENAMHHEWHDTAVR